MTKGTVLLHGRFRRRSDAIGTALAPHPGRPGSTGIGRSSERVADSAVHVLGLLVVLVGTGVLLHVGLDSPGWLRTLAVAPYLLGLAASFGCSAAYNMAPDGKRKSGLRRFDHAAVFMLIAGTYTPVVALSLPSAWSASLLMVVWTGALAGVTLKLLAPRRHERLGLALYLLLGWSGLVATVPLCGSLTSWQLTALSVAGLLYTGGVAFHLAQRLPFHNALWHASVLTAATAHYSLVLTLAASTS